VKAEVDAARMRAIDRRVGELLEVFRGVRDPLSWSVVLRRAAAELERIERGPRKRREGVVTS